MKSLITKSGMELENLDESCFLIPQVLGKSNRLKDKPTGSEDGIRKNGRELVLASSGTSQGHASVDHTVGCYKNATTLFFLNASDPFDLAT